MTYDFGRHLPLSPAALHILLALAGEDRHGYGIMQEIARQSEGQYKLGPGTLYDNLQKLMELSFVQEASRRAGNRPANDDPRRRYYKLTPVGRGLLAAEIKRLEGVVREAATHLRPALRADPRRA
jgi:DNA-binding PadR family transcriptional regulator